MALSRHCWLAILACLVCVTGCSSATSRVEVAGEVTVDASPVSDGTISLLPDRGHRGPAATTAIQGGRFQFTTADGPLPGPHRAVVSLGSQLPSGQPVMSIDQASAVAKRAQDNSDSQPAATRSPASTTSTTPPMPGRWETTVEIPAPGTEADGKLLQIRFQSPEPAQ